MKECSTASYIINAELNLKLIIFKKKIKISKGR